MIEPRVVRRAEMDAWLDDPRLVREIERAFVAYSAGAAVVPPVGELLFDEPPGDVHIKYGYLKDGPTYVIKVASSFYRNPERGLPSSQGLMLVFDRSSGALTGILLDEGHLTNVRTALAGAIAARRLAPPAPRAVGILGTGTQARLQLEALRSVLTFSHAYIWGRRPEAAQACAAELSRAGLAVHAAPTIDALAEVSDVIVTTTPSKAALLYARHLRPGMHVTAVGADSPDKQELDASVFARADVVVCDSRRQCAERGDLAHARRQLAFDVGKVPELGEVISGRAPGRRAATDITVVDLTGVAVQDVAIASFVMQRAVNR